MIVARCVFFVAILLSLLQLATSPALAHSQSYGFLNLNLTAESLEGTLDLAVRDLDTEFDLDRDHDAKITWGELRVRETSIVESLLKEITISTALNVCSLRAMPALTDARGGETYVVIPFRSECRGLDGPIKIGYRILFEIDAQHRGLVNVTTLGGTQTFVMTPGVQQVELTPGGEGWPSLILTWVTHGIHHILIGYDHILFVITLLLGTAVHHRGGSVWKVLREIAKVVTAFTISHSITLGLAALGILRVPVALAESLIAVTIAVAALNNLWPLVSRRIWLVALGFGLIHGIGFANVLTELGLPRGNLLAALLAFNIGVEIGQIVVVLAALPLVLLASRQKLGKYAIPVANCSIVAVALMWFSDRTFGTSLMPF